MRLAVSCIVASSLCFSSVPAFSLSCMMPNLGESFNQYQDSPDLYFMALGYLTPNGDYTDPNLAEPKPNKDGLIVDMGIPFDVEATFSGSFLGLNGLVEQDNKQVTVSMTCVAHWCGGFPQSDDEQFFFLRRSGADRLAIEIGPCPGAVFSKPDLIKRSVLKKCLGQGKCLPRDIRQLAN